MARGINKVIIVGNLGADPEVRYMPSGGAVATLSVATSEAWKDKQTGQMQDRTEWHRVVFFNRLGEICAEYLKKGAKIYLEGRIQTRKWQDKNTGQDRYTTEIVGSEMQMLDSRGGAGGSFDNAGYSSSNPMSMDRDSSSSSPMGYSANQSSQNSQSHAEPVMDSNFDDDIPF